MLYNVLARFLPVSHSYSHALALQQPVTAVHGPSLCAVQQCVVMAPHHCSCFGPSARSKALLDPRYDPAATLQCKSCACSSCMALASLYVNADCVVPAGHGGCSLLARRGTCTHTLVQVWGLLAPRERTLLTLLHGAKGYKGGLPLLGARWPAWCTMVQGS